MELKTIFLELFGRFTPDSKLAEQLWAEIEKSYTNSKRHYHTLTHLGNLYKELLPLKQDIQDWDTLLFSLFYHDVVYNTLKQNNEEKSAEMVVDRLSNIGIDKAKIDRCKAQILATKLHDDTTDNDTNLFTDADLSILGAEPETYREYTRQIRREYSIYPDMLYKPGRKKVLQHFLDMERIFKTPRFYNTYEATARENLAKELRDI